MLTVRQKAIQGFIVRFQRVNGFAPSIQEIMVDSGLASLSSVVYQLDQLQEKGYITRAAASARSICVLLTVNGKGVHHGNS